VASITKTVRFLRDKEEQFTYQPVFSLKVIQERRCREKKIKASRLQVFVCGLTDQTAVDRDKGPGG